jgi:integrase
MPRKRNPEHRGLPPRWRFYHGAYRYQVPPGLEHLWDGKRQFTLGRTLVEAYRTWAERVERAERITTVAQLLDRYALEVIPRKAARTQIDDLKRLPILRKLFGHANVRGDLKPHHIYEYVDRNRHRLTAAHREVELLSHVFTMAVNWGLTDGHPWKGTGITLQRELRPRPAERYVEDWEVIEALSLPPRRKRGSVLMCQAYVRVKLLTGLRKTDLLWLPAQHSDGGLRVHPSKTRHSSGVRQLFSWNDALRAAVQLALAARPVDIGPWLFCNRYGRPLIRDDNVTNSFDSQWGRFMNRCLRETHLEKRFAERDLRAKVATDAESLERAQALLGHADARLTKRVYIRRPQLVLPARGVKE